MKVIVTGGAGFIGSHTVDLLINKGYDVVIIDNLSTGKKENINSEAKFYDTDIRNEKKLDEIFKKEKPEFVIHLAAQTSVRKSLDQPTYDQDINIRGSINILEMCKKYKVKKIVYSSSAAIYGEPIKLPIDENHSIRPTSPYGVSKYAAELFISSYSHLYDFDYVILRYSNVYGPRQDPEGEAGVVTIFLNNIKNNKPVIIYGDGKQTRDFIFVKDVARANVLVLNKTIKNKIFNISSNTQTSIINLANLMGTIFNKNVDIKFDKPIKGEIKNSCLDNSLAKLELDFNNKFNLEQGISFFQD